MNSAPHIPGKTLPGRPSSFSKGINAFTKLSALSLILLLSTLALSSGEEAEQLSDRARMRQQNLNTVTNSWKANLDRAANDANLFVRRGLTANIAERKVEILGEATSLGKNAVTEFFIVAEHSSHDYEALITSFALPSDIEAALIQLNMQPGLSTDHKNLRFWSKGERVEITVESFARSEAAHRIETMVIDTRTKAPLPASGLIFCALPRRTLTNANQICITDIDDPGSIASSYNEPSTLFDPPRRVPKTEVYETYLSNPLTSYSPGALLKITITPQNAPDKRRVRDFTLRIRQAPQGNGLPNAKVTLVNSTDTPIPADSLAEILNSLRTETEQQHDPYLSLEIGPDVTLNAIHTLARVLEKIEGEDGIRVEPPRGNQLYYKAYIPKAEYRDRNKRLSQPWELSLQKGKEGVSAKLTQIKEKWIKNRVRPELEAVEYPIESPIHLVTRIRELGNGLPVILVFADADLTHSELMSYLAPARISCPNIHVFTEKNVTPENND